MCCVLLRIWEEKMFFGAEFTSYFLVGEVKHEVECCEDITARITASLYVAKGLAL